MTSRLRLVPAVTLALALVLGAAITSPAVGGPTFLTLGKAKKVFVTKKKAKKVYVTKAQASSYLTAATGDGRYLIRTGESRVSVLPGGWVIADNTDNILVAPQTIATAVVADGLAANDVDFFAPAAVPTMVGGTSLKVVGLEVCYAFPATALDQPVIDRIALQRSARSAGTTVPGTPATVASDGTGRVDDACTTIRFAPVALLPTDLVGIGLRIDFADANTQVRLGAASLILVG